MPIYKYDKKHFKKGVRIIRIKPIDQMNNEELKAEFRRRAAECGGCNRRPDEED